MATVSTTNRLMTWGAAAPPVPAPRVAVEKPKLSPPTVPWWEGPDHAQFTSSFDATKRRRLIEEDLFAGTSVAIVLTTVVALGLLAMSVTVLFTLV